MCDCRARLSAAVHAIRNVPNLIILAITPGIACGSHATSSFFLSSRNAVGNLMAAEAVGFCASSTPFQPEIWPDGSILHVQRAPQVLAREEVEPVPAYPKDRGAHAKVIGSSPDKLMGMRIDWRSCHGLSEF